jgi:hypothetical protein
LTPRRFPPPWSVEELNACFVVKNCAGQKLAYVYYEEEPGQAVDGEVAHEDELSGAFLFGRAISALVIFAPSKFCEWPTLGCQLLYPKTIMAAIPASRANVRAASMNP